MNQCSSSGAGVRRSSSHGPRSVRGISLIEVLVAVVVLSIGLLGVAAMQSVALRGGQSSLETSQAVMQTNAILDAIRANRANAAAYNTDAMVCTAVAGSDVAGSDLQTWITDLKNNIANNDADTTTCGEIRGCPEACVITIQWDDSRAGGGNERQVVTRTTI
ncbi:type IV pilus modification protein PilV [Pseudoxanthomonas sp.]|jgi:type IV pilus modification protein PilV|uniref:type IV pilus modification protein PilV n=1 Tax=Pseudoxanthomonas sp. TaxID=1871049 RepID=UPI002FE12EF7